MEEKIKNIKSTDSDNCHFERIVSQPLPQFRHLDLFSGIGGFALAAKSIWEDRYENVGFCEIDKFCQKVLKKNFGEDITIYEDINNLRKEDISGTVDLITGGFPCQPFSVAGKRKGASDDRYLWGEMLRVIKEIKPTYVIGENVANLWNMGFENLLLDLGNEGYKVESFIIPACAVNAPHKRDRVWIVAYRTNQRFAGRERIKRNDDGLGGERRNIKNGCGRIDGSENDTNTNIDRFNTTKIPIRKGQKEDSNFAGGSESIADTNQFNGNNGGFCASEISQLKASGIQWDKNWYEVATEFCRVDDGIPNRVDRLKGLGNSIVPQIAMVLLAALKTIDDKFKRQVKVG